LIYRLTIRKAQKLRLSDGSAQSEQRTSISIYYPGHGSWFGPAVRQHCYDAHVVDAKAQHQGCTQLILPGASVTIACHSAELSNKPKESAFKGSRMPEDD
jgi:hypothetical protein